MPDVDYAKVIGRLALFVADGPADNDDMPDTIWCDSGTVIIQPLQTYTKVTETTTPYSAGGASYEATIDSEGYLTHLGKRAVWVIDLTSEKVNPHFGPNKSTHKLIFKNVKAGDTDVAFPSVDVRITAAGDGVSPGNANDITILAPIVPGVATPIYRGERGTGIADATVTPAGELELRLTDESVVNAGELPVGPGGSAEGVAGYLAESGPVKEALDQANAELMDDPASAFRAKQTATVAAAVETQAVVYVKGSSAAAVQAAIDSVEAAGGGEVHLDPRVHYQWNNTVLMAEGVHLYGHWATITSTAQGQLAMLMHKGYDQPGYGGAGNWTINQIVIDSPLTNGIVTAHCHDIGIHGVRGLDTAQHFIDLAAAKNVRMSDLAFTGRAMAGVLQFDAALLPPAVNQRLVLDGQVVDIFRDDTPCQNVTVDGLVMDLTTTGTQSAVHLHRGAGSDITITNAIIKGHPTAVLTDAGTSWTNVQFVNCIFEGAITFNNAGAKPKFYSCIHNGVRLDDSPLPPVPEPALPPQQTMAVINHGANADVARPQDVGAVTWIGTVPPNQLEFPDLFWDTAEGAWSQGAIPVPKQIDGLGLWLDASRINLADGAAVATWQDRSGAERHLNAFHSSTRPVFDADGVNGRPSVRFAGAANGRLMAASGFDLARSVSGLTIFAVINPTVANTDVRLFEIATAVGPGATRAGLRMLPNGAVTPGGRRLDTDAYLTMEGFVGPGTVPQIHVARFDYANAAALVRCLSGGGGTLNKASTGWQTAGSTSATDSAAISLGARGDGNNPYDGAVAEVLVYRRALSDTERGQVETYLRAKYGLP